MIKAKPYQSRHENALWFPYVQMGKIELPGQVISASGSRFTLEDGNELIDAISSWWCVIHGYNHPELNQAAHDQIDTFSHIMMGGLSHPFSKELADRLVDLSPEGLNHVFFADSGSVGVEIALKMALQYWHNLKIPGRTKFACLKNGYHGDTFGCMSVGEPDDAMQKAFPELLIPAIFVRPPRLGSEPYSLQSAINELQFMFENHHRELAAFICEPMMQGYGGFNVYPAEYLKEIRKLCDKYNVLLILDEVATGLGRTGKMFASEHAGISPDINIVSKALTAGYLGMSATLASTKVFNAFVSDSNDDVFMHGPTFMGNALACRIALASLELIEKQGLQDACQIENWLNQNLHEMKVDEDPKHPQHGIIRKTIFGACAVIEVDDASRLEGLALWARNRGVWLRPIGPYLYTMPAYNMSYEDLTQVTDAMIDWFKIK